MLMSDWIYNSALGCYEVDAWMECDGDGANGQSSLPCYAPHGVPSLDLLANAGHPGNWWGILTDNGRADGNPVVQDATQPAPGAYISTTSYQFSHYPNGSPMPARDVNRYLDAAAVLFIVVPRSFQRGVPGVVLGCYCEVWRPGRDGGALDMTTGIVGDIGPKFGEASLAMCKLFDPQASCRGSNIGRVSYRVWPGREVSGYPLLRA